MRWQKAKMRRLKTLSSFGWFVRVSLAVGLSGRLLGSFGCGFLRLILWGLMTSGGASFVCVSLVWVGRFVLCFPTALRVTCGGRLLVRVSTLLTLRAVYCLYIPALRNLTGSDVLK